MGYEVDFLPVGKDKSGDAIALRFGNLFGSRSEQTVVVVDGGFRDSGEALVSHVRDYYGTDRVDVVVSTHPDADHASGLEVVLEKCKVGSLWMHLPWQHTDDIARMFKNDRVTDTSVSEALRRSLDNARALEKLAIAKGIPIIEPFAGVSDATRHFLVVGPTAQFYESLLPQFRGTPEPKQGSGLLEKFVTGAREVIHRIAENFHIETLDDTGETSAENNSSAILHLAVNGHGLLFTGDAGMPALTDMADRLTALNFDFSGVNFVQVPHHGSRRNVGPTILDRIIGPKLREEAVLKTAFVSVGTEGAPKHPSKKVTNAFRRRGAPVHATDGQKKWHYYNAPARNWGASVALPLYTEVED